MSAPPEREGEGGVRLCQQECAHRGGEPARPFPSRLPSSCTHRRRRKLTLDETAETARKSPPSGSSSVHGPAGLTKVQIDGPSVGRSLRASPPHRARPGTISRARRRRSLREYTYFIAIGCGLYESLVNVELSTEVLLCLRYASKLLRGL